MKTKPGEKLKPFNSVMLCGRRWFRRGPGNTYHSVAIYIDGECVHKVDFAYGYGDQYQYTAFAWLQNNGYLKLDHANGGCQSPWRWCEEHGVKFASNVVDVTRKGDL